MKIIVVPVILALWVFATGVRAKAPRTDAELTANWRFIRQDVPDAAAASFDDSKWDQITLPHTWNAQDGQDGGNNYYRGPAWYRTHVPITPNPAKSYFLYFEGAATITDVYLNGKKAGTHSGGFSAFCFDITSLLDPKGDNILAVKVNNARNTHVAPLTGDFTVFGGLYRNVHLLTRNNISISPIDDGIASSGIYLKQSNVSPDKADIEASIKLRNNEIVTKGPPPLTVQWTLLDANQKQLQTGSVTPLSGGYEDAIAKFSIDHPHLWNGTKDPYLYSVQIDIKSGDTILDSDTQPLGLRYYHADPDKGFFLNGQSYNLHGVNRHQDRIDKGWAISPADHEEDYKLIAEMGCTVVRLCHYEHAQHFYDLCDKGGMVVWAELGLVNDIDMSPEFAQITRQQLTELIKQNYNHPSICFWSLYNELNARSTNAQGMALMTGLNTLAHSIDPTRLTVGANSQGPNTAIATLTDLSSFNRYDGWYSNTPATWPATLDQLRAALPNRAIAISEYGAGASIIQHAENPVQPRTAGRWHPEEWQCIVHEAAWKALSERPWLWATMLWSFADFAIDSRNEGDTPGRNDKGMVTYDRKTKKDVYYFYQANWTTTPMVHINLPDKLSYSPTRIKVYSNCESVELLADGKSLGTRQAKDHIFVWDSLQLAAQGKVNITANGKNAKAGVDLTIDPTMPESNRPQVP